jgi:hypothetical protein
VRWQARQHLQRGKGSSKHRVLKHSIYHSYPRQFAPHVLSMSLVRQALLLSAALQDEEDEEQMKIIVTLS